MSSRTDLSCTVDIDGLGGEVKTFDLCATGNQAAAIAARFEIPQLKTLNARIKVHRVPEGDVLVSGAIEALAQQICVVTLEPFETRVETDFRRRYAGRSDIPEELAELEDVEPLTPSIDLGELVAQEFGLALDPYPRAPGAALDQGNRDDGESPFAVLRELKR